jgi:HPt (histidine-containing phosphotransfer) domain-containing protein
MMSEYNYLLQTDKLTYDDLLTYLRRRERAYISFLEFCIDKSVFNKSVLLDILQHQELNKTLFVDSLRAIAGEEFTNDLIKVYYSQIPSIFRFIEYSDKIETKINIVAQPDDVEEVSKFKPDYYTEVHAEVENQQIKLDLEVQVVAGDSGQAQSAGSQEESDKVWVFPDLQDEDSDPSLIEDFLQTFDEEKKTDMENTIMSLKRKLDDELVAAMSFLYRDFHTIKGSSRFAKLKVFEMLTHDLEELISVAQSIYASLKTDSRDLIEEALLLGMDVLWSLKNTIAENMSEKPMADNEDWKDRVDRMVKCLKRAKAEAFEALQGQTAEDLFSKF